MIVSLRRIFGEDYNRNTVLDGPSAQLYFSDPDGHTVEYITLLHETPESGFVGSLSAWKARRKLVQPR